MQALNSFNNKEYLSGQDTLPVQFPKIGPLVSFTPHLTHTPSARKALLRIKALLCFARP